MRVIFLLFFLSINYFCYSNNDTDIIVSSRIISVVDSVFFHELDSVEYLKIRNNVKFGLNLLIDDTGTVVSCDYTLLANKEYEAVINKICELLLLLEISDYHNVRRIDGQKIHEFRMLVIPSYYSFKRDSLYNLPYLITPAR